MLSPMVDRFKALDVELQTFAKALKRKLAQVDREHCPNHEDTPLPVDWDATLSKSWFDSKRRLVIRYGKCPECEKLFQQALVNEKFRNMGIPEKVLHATFNNFDMDSESKRVALAKALKRLNKGTGFLIMHGSFGTGKSHVAAACLKYSGNGVFITEADLVAELRQTYETGGGNAMVEKYRSVKLLVLDELSLEVKGVDISQLLYRVLAHRYDKGLLTIITSNEELSVILQILGGKLTDRVREDYQSIKFNWESHRNPK